MPPRPDSAPHTPLSDYIREYMQREEISANKLAARCKDPETGQRILVQWLLNLASARITDRAPELWRLRALAAGLSTTDAGLDRARYREQVEVMKRLTAAQWLQMEVLEAKDGDGSVITISVPPDLSPAARERLRQWAEQMARDLPDLK